MIPKNSKFDGKIREGFIRKKSEMENRKNVNVEPSPDKTSNIKVKKSIHSNQPSIVC